jgi:hypothetical protein
MTLDVQSLRDDVHRLVEQAAKIQRIVDRAAAIEPADLGLPPAIVVRDWDDVVTYLGAHHCLVAGKRSWATGSPLS